MTSDEQEAFLREHQVINSVVMRAFHLDDNKIVRDEGWRLSMAVPRTSSLHVKQAGLSDSFRIFVAPTLEGCWVLAREAAGSAVEEGDIL